ncbi:MAG TPA: iron chelate uptake ABC transporter family permease subunit [Methanocella sp.]|nr:iron chelate uptake ABC transporter family permease subunit [Methanocella sp.]
MEYSVRRWVLITICLMILTTAVAIISIATGPANLSPDKVTQIILSRIPFVQDHIAKTWTAGDEAIVIQVRLPRVILGLLVGASLALAGVTTQGIFKNPMADPYILGVSSGAAFGVAVSMVIGITIGMMTINIMLGAFAGALIASFLVFNIARTHYRVPVETLLLSGIAVSAFFSAITSFLMYISGNSLSKIVFWIMGGLQSGGWDRILILIPFFIAGGLIIFAFARDLNLIQLGDESAAHLGTDVSRVKTILLVVSSLLAAAAVSVSGIIGFVGLIIPHMMRLIVGPDHRVLIPSSILVGAMFLTVADTFSRMIVQPTEMPVGIVTAVIGAPFFVYLLLRQKKSLT